MRWMLIPLAVLLYVSIMLMPLFSTAYAAYVQAGGAL